MTMRSGSWVASQQIVAGQVRLSAEVHRIREPRNAGLESLVTALAQLHETAGLDDRTWQIAQLNRRTCSSQDDVRQPTIGAAHESEPSQDEPIVDDRVERQRSIAARNHARANGASGEIDTALLVAKLCPALR